MTPTEWAGFGAGVCAVVTSLLVGLRWVIKSYLVELKVNSGLSMKDAINRIDERSSRLEMRADELFTIISKRQ